MSGALDQLPGCVMLVCALLLLAQNRAASRITICRLQGAALTVAALWQAHAQHAAGMYLSGAIIFAADVVLIPLILQRLALASITERPAVPNGVSIMLGIIVFGIAILATPEIAYPAALAGGGLAVALSIMLLGLLMLIRPAKLCSLMTSFLCIGNALVLTAVSLPAMPLAPEFVLAISTLVMLPAAIFGLVGGDPFAPAQTPGA